MSTNALVRTAWAENVFANINSGANSYSRVIEPKSQTEVALGMHNDTKKVYVWFYPVTVSDEHNIIGGGFNCRTQNYQVSLTHIQEKIEGANDTAHDAVIDAFETLSGLVRINLGINWDSTVDLYEKASPVEISSGEWGGKPVWIGKQIYTAKKRISS